MTVDNQHYTSKSAQLDLLSLEELIQLSANVNLSFIRFPDNISFYVCDILHQGYTMPKMYGKIEKSEIEPLLLQHICPVDQIYSFQVNQNDKLILDLIKEKVKRKMINCFGKSNE
jgi:hypothetical protein